MPFALLFFGIIFMTAAVKGNHKKLFDLLKEDFTGSGNFFLWVLSIVFLVLLGNIKSLKPVSDAFITLVLIAIVLASYRDGKDIFADFMTQLKNGTR